MLQIENIDLQKALDDIARNNTAWHLENDLGISIGQMKRTAQMDDPTEKTLIWISYPAGIDCYSERDVFLKDTRGFNGVQYHANGANHERKLAYAVEVTGVQEGKLMGSLFEIDLQAYGAFVRENALSYQTMRLFLTDAYDHGAQTVMSKQEFDRAYPQELPEMKYWRHEPADTHALEELLNRQYVVRSLEAEPGDLWLHTSNLYDERLSYYSEKIMESFGKLSEANSPDQQYFSVELPSFVANTFHAEQLTRLLDALPFDSTAFSIRKGQRELHAEVPRGEMLLLREAETLAKEYHVILEAFAPWEYRAELEIEDTANPVFDTKAAKQAIAEDTHHISAGSKEAGYILAHLQELVQSSPDAQEPSALGLQADRLHRRLADYLAKQRKLPEKNEPGASKKPSILARLQEGKKVAAQGQDSPKTAPKRDNEREV